MYKTVYNGYTNEAIAVTKEIGGRLLTIPFDPGNTDYQEYLEWVAEGNTAEDFVFEPADD